MTHVIRRSRGLLWPNQPTDSACLRSFPLSGLATMPRLACFYQSRIPHRSRSPCTILLLQPYQDPLPSTRIECSDRKDWWVANSARARPLFRASMVDDPHRFATVRRCRANRPEAMACRYSEGSGPGSSPSRSAQTACQGNL